MIKGSVIGILSERDIVRAVAKRGTAVFNDAVSMHMTAEVITTSEDERPSCGDGKNDQWTVSPSPGHPP